MTHTKRILVTAAMVVGVAAGAATPALADQHSPVPPQDSHATFVPLDNHAPVAPQDSHAT
ncbi:MULTISPECIES: hypothetical protein [Streptomyces]|uniref:hypothetical protein n=1 Tax=Streptomyces TaxID=1883 RepID=UPI002DD9F8F9|nr:MULTISPECIES: hypothetical protein [unclassified Streptomyces]WSD97677.1 hypothetical protein OG758_28105 [Streptomyces sp. NBC_01474]